MSFWFVISFALLVLAIVGIFVELPAISDYAFWIAVIAYTLLAGASFHHYHRR
jgi:hypothetical protein